MCDCDCDSTSAATAVAIALHTGCSAQPQPQPNIPITKCDTKNICIYKMYISISHSSLDRNSEKLFMHKQKLWRQQKRFSYLICHKRFCERSLLTWLRIFSSFDFVRFVFFSVILHIFSFQINPVCVCVFFSKMCSIMHDVDFSHYLDTFRVFFFFAIKSCLRFDEPKVDSVAELWLVANKRLR